MTVFVPYKGDKSEEKENVEFLLGLGVESAPSLWFMIVHGLFSLASHSSFKN